MANPDFGRLRSIQISPDLLSRGSGERVALQEAVVYDFMPPVLGNRFRIDPTLRRGVHFFSFNGSFMMGEEAFQELATNEINAGNLIPALEAYKRGLHKAVGFACSSASLRGMMLLSPAEIERLSLQGRFGAIERKLIRMIIAAEGDTKIDLPQYAQWVSGVRTLERDAPPLNRKYFGQEPKDPATGIKLRDTYAQMQRYRDAAWISRELGDKEAEARYTELAQTDPQDSSRYEEILRRIEHEYDKSRGYI